MDLMDMLSATEMKVPIYMVLCYIGVLSFCVLLGRIRMGLALSFLFVFYIGYLHNRSLIVESMKGSAVGIAIYAALGLTLIVLAVAALFSSPK